MVTSILDDMNINNYENRSIFDGSYLINKKGDVLIDQLVAQHCGGRIVCAVSAVYTYAGLVGGL